MLKDFDETGWKPVMTQYRHSAMYSGKIKT